MSIVPPFITAPVLGFVMAELIINCAVVLLMLTVVSLRIFARVRGAGIGVDDILIMVAAPLGVGSESLPRSINDVVRLVI